MAKNTAKTTYKNPNTDENQFLNKIGLLFQKLRKNAGYSSIQSFVNAMELSYSQYQGYESGKNITLTSFKRTMQLFNLDVEDWLKIDLSNNDKVLKNLLEKANNNRIEQVREQVEKIIGRSNAQKYTDKDLERFIQILIFCITPKSKNKILSHLSLGPTINNFKRIAGKPIEFSWIDFTDKKSLNSPKQEYVTTEKGKSVLRELTIKENK